MLEKFRGILSTLKGAADNDVCVTEEVVYGLFSGKDYEIVKLGNTIDVLCDYIIQSLFFVMFERVEDSNEYCIRFIVTSEPSEYLYARQ